MSESRWRQREVCQIFLGGNWLKKKGNGGWQREGSLKEMERIEKKKTKPKIRCNLGRNVVKSKRTGSNWERWQRFWTGRAEVSKVWRKEMGWTELVRLMYRSVIWPNQQWFFLSSFTLLWGNWRSKTIRSLLQPVYFVHLLRISISHVFSLFLPLSRLLLLSVSFFFIPSLLFLFTLSLSLSFPLCHSSYCFHSLSFSLFSYIFLSLSIILSSYHPLLTFLFPPSPLSLALLPYSIALFPFQSWVWR